MAIGYNVRIKVFPDGSRQATTYSSIHSKGANRYCNIDGSWMGVKSGSSSLKDLTAKARRIEHESANRAKNRIYDYARANDWQWFVTLTFNPELVDSFNYAIVAKRLSSWLDTVRRRCPDMKYLFVPEFHRSKRIHFHGLIANCENLSFVESGHYTSAGEPVYNIGSYHLGFTTATRIKDLGRCQSYIAKYVTKDLMEHIKNRKRYWHSNNLDLPEEIFFLEDLDAIDFESGSVYQKMLEHWCPWGTETINYYEYPANCTQEYNMIRKNR